MDISLIGQCMLKTRLSNVLTHLNIRFVSNVVRVCVCVCVCVCVYVKTSKSDYFCGL